MFELAPLDVGEARLNASRRVRLFAFDQLEQFSLAFPDALVQFMQCSSPLRRVALELGRAGRADLLRCPRDFVADTHEARALLLALAFEPLGVDRDSRLRLRDQLLLTLRKLRELVRRLRAAARSRSSPHAASRASTCCCAAVRASPSSSPAVRVRSAAAARRSSAIRRSCSVSREAESARARTSVRSSSALRSSASWAISEFEPALRTRQLLVGAPRRAQEVTQADRGERGGE